MDESTKKDIKTVAGFVGKAGVIAGAVTLRIVSAPFAKGAEHAITHGAIDLCKEIDEWSKE